MKTDKLDSRIRKALQEGRDSNLEVIHPPVTPAPAVYTPPLRVWWIPQVPGKPFYVPVADRDQAVKILTVLAEYDLFQLKHKIKPDYANAGGLQVLEDGEWVEWYDNDGNDIDYYFS